MEGGLPGLAKDRIDRWKGVPAEVIKMQEKAKASHHWEGVNSQEQAPKGLQTESSYPVCQVDQKDPRKIK